MGYVGPEDQDVSGIQVSHVDHDSSQYMFC